MAKDSKKNVKEKPRYYSNREMMHSEEVISEAEFKERRKQNRKRRGIVMLVILVVATIFGLWFFETQVHHNRVSVPMKIEIEDYNPSQASKIPILVEGSSVIDEQVSDVYYVTSDDSELKLIEGEYTIYAIGSPITDSGNVYEYPDTQYHVSIDSEGNVSGDTLVFSFTKIDPQDVTDEEIDAACQWMEDSGEFAGDADRYREAAIAARDAASQF